MKHLLSLPTRSGPHPALCFLHGYDEAGPLAMEKALRRHGPLHAGNPPQVAREFLIIAPQLPFGGDVWHRYAGEVQRLVDEQVRRGAADPKRLYLTGFSFGANGVFDLAALQPGIWAALWAVDPTRVPREPPLEPVWLSFGEVARRKKAEFIRSMSLQDAASGASGERLYFDAGDDHVGAARRAYADAHIYAWLLGHVVRGAAAGSIR